MTSNTQTDNAAQEQQPKKIVERSAAYPAISIEEAIRFIESIAKNFPGSPFINRDDIAAVLKTKPHNIHRDIAAAAHYGLLKRQKDSYQVTDLYKTISNPISEAEKAKCLLEVFGFPKLYQELLTKHDGHVIPPELKTHLIRFHKIAEKAAQEVADTFISNARYVGAANEHNILSYKQNLLKATTGGIEYAEVIPPDNSGNLHPDNQKPPPLGGNAGEEGKPPAHDQLFLNEMNNQEKLKIRLSEGKFAYLIYPLNLNSKDIIILNKQIELLQILLE